jgi:hypothetical protein
MSVIRIARACAGFALLVASPLASQTRATPSPAALRRAVETISEADFAAKLGALAHDSTRGRETPSPELERATDWVAAQFRRIGLRPAGDSGGYLQRFQLLNTRIDSLSTVAASGPGFSATWALGRDVAYLGGSGTPPSDLRDLPVVLLAGMPSDTLRPFGDVSVRGAAILHVLPPDQLNPRAVNPVSRRAQSEGALLHIVAAEFPGPLWAQIARGTFPQRWTLAGGAARGAGAGTFYIYGLQLGAASDLLRAAGEDPAALTAPAGRSARPLNGFTISIASHSTTLQLASVANVIGVIEGSDRALRDEAVVFTGHMDHVGVVGGRCRPSSALPADSICNGADDNASGTVGVIELAEAFATLRPRPARTLVFAAVTAEERGLFGSRFYVDHPVIPLDRTAAVINLDMIARNPRDSVGLVEKDFTSLGGVVDRLAREHPELRLTPKAHAGLYPNSDHFPFAQRGVPALFFFSGIHDDLHTAADNVDRADSEQAARIVRLAFLTGLEVANTVARPTWDPAARARIVGTGGN